MPLGNGASVKAPVQSSADHRNSDLITPDSPARDAVGIHGAAMVDVFSMAPGKMRKPSSCWLELTHTDLKLAGFVGS